MEAAVAHLNCYSSISKEVIKKYEVVSGTKSQYKICRIRRSASHCKTRFRHTQREIKVTFTFCAPWIFLLLLLLLSGIYNRYEYEPPHSWGYTITHKDTPQSVGLLWTSDQPVAETSIWQHTQHLQQTNIHAPGEIRTLNPSRRSSADPCLRPLGHWDRPNFYYYIRKITKWCTVLYAYDYKRIIKIISNKLKYNHSFVPICQWSTVPPEGGVE
jgi:hypothetical protein